MTSRGRLVILDGNALLHRAWHALPHLQTKDGRVVNAAYGFLLVFLKVLKELKPSHVVVAFDRREPTFRHERYTAYKATREKQPDELYAQLPIVKEALAAFRVPVLEAAGYEADDVIATVVAEANREKLPAIIVTGDLDALQLVNTYTKVYTLRRGLVDAVVYDEAAVRERFGLSPDTLVDYRALRGDPSDNLPGVKGIGEKTASELLRTYRTLDALYAAVDGKKNPMPPLTERLRVALRTHRKDAYLTRELSEVRNDVPLTFSIKDFVATAPDRERLVSLFRDLEFTSLLTKLPDAAKKQSTAPLSSIPNRAGYHLVNDATAFQKFLNALGRQSVCAIDTETTSLSTQDAELLGASFSWRAGEAYYVPLDGQLKRLQALRPFLESATLKKWGQNIKYDIAVLHRAGVAMGGVVGDTMVADYLLHPGSRAHDLDSLTFTVFGHRKIPITDLIGTGKEQRSMRDVPLATLGTYACEDADYTWQLAEHVQSELQKNHLTDLFQRIEVPLIPVLAAMETRGMKLDVRTLAVLNRRVGERLAVLEQNITQLAGEPFNIASPRQLATVLFTQLGLPTAGIAKTKSGYSTAATELEKLHGQHPIIAAVLEHRELAKLKSTYLEALPALVHKRTKRLHTSFNQTVTATGRLSSSDPNLQNIPVRTELGAAVRRAFVADRGYRLLAADYSQIELRVIASLANDQTMLEVFRRGGDIHRATAAAVHGIAESAVTKAIRYTAKEVNFGVIYGMGPWGLASRTGMSREEARAFIEQYFTTFPGIKRYLEEVVALARQRGYAETLFGRRRYLPELASGVGQLRQAGERMAVNMPVQGTAADIIKLAMVRVHEGLAKVSKQAELVLQVHDELVIEVPAKDVAAVADFVRDAMVSVVELQVPIEVHLSAGKNWGELSPLVAR